MSKTDPLQLEEKFLAALRHHFVGWQKKVARDFSTANFERELLERVLDK